jgi:hypothetical protein
MSNDMNLSTLFVPPPYAPSCTHVKELRQVFIKDPRLETHHRGAYILVRSITPPDKSLQLWLLQAKNEGIYFSGPEN